MRQRQPRSNRTDTPFPYATRARSAGQGRTGRADRRRAGGVGRDRARSLGGGGCRAARGGARRSGDGGADVVRGACGRVGRAQNASRPPKPGRGSDGGGERKSVREGKGVSLSCDLGGVVSIYKKK